MREVIVVLISLIFFNQENLLAQHRKKIFDPKLDGGKQIEEAIQIAQKEQKYILVQIGGNWCNWCILFHNFLVDHKEISTFLKNNYIVVHLNFSKQNENKGVLNRFLNPQNKIPFPILLILNDQGELLHTQDPRYLEGEVENYLAKPTLKLLQKWALYKSH